MSRTENNDSVFELENEVGLDAGVNKDAVYPNAQIRISRDQFSLRELKFEVDQKKLQLDPDFQRSEVWNSKQQYELIESILMGIPLPVIYLFQDEKSNLQIVDGRQRITAIKDYLDNKFALKDLKILTAFNGKKFNDLDDAARSSVERYQMQAYVIQPPTPEQVKYDIFDRVNRGGTPLNNQEMRNALYYGKSTGLIKFLAGQKSFKDVTGNINDTRMKAQYAILRLLGFYLLRTTNLFEYKSNINEFLVPVMKHINNMDDKEIEALKEKFNIAMKTSYNLLGKDAFRFPVVNMNRRPINMALFEALGYLFMIKDFSSCDKEALVVKLKEKVKSFDHSEKFKYAVDSGTNVVYRFTEVEKFAKELSC